MKQIIVLINLGMGTKTARREIKVFLQHDNRLSLSIHNSVESKNKSYCHIDDVQSCFLIELIIPQ